MKYTKALFLDIDGTILTSRHLVSERVRNAIRHLSNKGVLIVLSTGRSWEAVEAIYNHLSLDGPTICYNGAAVVRGPDGRYAYESGLDDSTSRYIIEQARQRGLELIAYRDRQFYYEKAGKEIRAYQSRVPLRGNLINFDDFSELNLTKCIIISEHADKLESMRLDLHAPTSPVRVSAMYSNRTCLETVAHNIDKGTGLKTVCKLYGIPVSETIAIGDGWNDYPMLTTADEAWIMGGAPLSLKEHFPEDRIIPSSDEDGAALVMETMLEDMS